MRRLVLEVVAHALRFLEDFRQALHSAMPRLLTNGHKTPKEEMREMLAVGWTSFVVAVLGAGAIALLALSRGEPVNALWMVVAAGCVFAVSYRFHSAWLMACIGP